MDTHYFKKYLSSFWLIMIELGKLNTAIINFMDKKMYYMS